MRSKLNRLLCFLALALPAAAQLDSAQLRVKFDAPLERETFRIPPGFDLVVDYGAGNQVCTLQVPAVVEDANVQSVDDMKQNMYAFLAELVPDAMRGKEINRGASVFGAPGNGVSISSVDYEHVRIIEVNYANQPFRSENTITVKFKSPACQQAAAH